MHHILHYGYRLQILPQKVKLWILVNRGYTLQLRHSLMSETHSDTQLTFDNRMTNKCGFAIMIAQVRTDLPVLVRSLRYISSRPLPVAPLLSLSCRECLRAPRIQPYKRNGKHYINNNPKHCILQAEKALQIISKNAHREPYLQKLVEIYCQFAR